MKRYSVINKDSNFGQNTMKPGINTPEKLY